jgi:nucleoside-diphosphate-sugar epimerase
MVEVASQEKPLVLVTGVTGFLGAATANAFL